MGTSPTAVAMQPEESHMVTKRAALRLILVPVLIVAVLFGLSAPAKAVEPTTTTTKETFIVPFEQTLFNPCTIELVDVIGVSTITVTTTLREVVETVTIKTLTNGSGTGQLTAFVYPFKERQTFLQKTNLGQIVESEFTDKLRMKAPNGFDTWVVRAVFKIKIALDGTITLNIARINSDQCRHNGEPEGDEDVNNPNDVPTSDPPSAVIDFNDLARVNGPLNGVYPTGVVDWGTGRWIHSAPWGLFATNSISFTATVKSASFKFITPRRLVSVRTFNGGTTASTVTLSCAGNPSRTASIGPNELVTIDTRWSNACATVTLAASNGWNTNFDDITYETVP
jgi:hypothetical protein